MSLCTVCTCCRFNTSMDILNEYLEEYEFDPKVKTSLRKYFHHCRCVAANAERSQACTRGVCTREWIVTRASSPPPLLRDLSPLCEYCRALRREEQFKTLITTHMSPELQGIVTSHCYGRYLENIPFFRFDTKHLRGIKLLRAEEEKQMFITQVGCVGVGVVARKPAAC